MHVNLTFRQRWMHCHRINMVLEHDRYFVLTPHQCLIKFVIQFLVKVKEPPFTQGWGDFVYIIYPD